MVLIPAAATIVPDEAAWAVWGHDLAAAGWVAAPSPERATALVVCDPLPAALLAAAREAWSRMPGHRVLVPLAAELAGGPAQAIVDAHHATGAADQAAHGHAMGHGEMGLGEPATGGDDMAHGHGDMMAIVGPPSADGLVMEDLSLRLGPISPVLPGGLVADLTLDGDIVAAVALQATLAVPPEDGAAGRPPDPLTPVAWRAAIAGARGVSPSGGVAAVERERVRSHAAWLRSLGRALGSTELFELGAALLAPASTPAAASALAARAGRALSGRSLRRRLEGRAVSADAGALRGPNARAAGHTVDARAEDPRYAGLGFAAVVHDGGDALARCLVRVGEIAQALDLADRAGDEHAPGPATVEGPRGPLRACLAGERLTLEAPGSAAALQAAAQAVVSLELGAAIVALVSFDLSPWRVGP